jgi:hypothetical protein
MDAEKGLDRGSVLVIRRVHRVVVVTLTALDLEYDAVRRHLTDVRDYVYPVGKRFENAG